MRERRVDQQGYVRDRRGRSSWSTECRPPSPWQAAQPPLLRSTIQAPLERPQGGRDAELSSMMSNRSDRVCDVSHLQVPIRLSGYLNTITSSIRSYPTFIPHPATYAQMPPFKPFQGEDRKPRAPRSLAANISGRPPRPAEVRDTRSLLMPCVLAPRSRNISSFLPSELLEKPDHTHLHQVARVLCMSPDDPESRAESPAWLRSSSRFTQLNAPTKFLRAQI